MAVAIPDFAFTLGEVTPALFGRFDVARLHSACSTLRNMFVNFHGGAYSRAGTAFVGFSKQTGRSFPPRLIPFQQSITQGLCLEFGNFYMRVIFDGAFVTDLQGAVVNVTQANPAVMTASVSEYGAASAVPINGGVFQTYAPGDLVTLAGGTFTTPAQLRVTTTKLLSLSIGLSGNGYAPADTVNLAGGTQTTNAVVTVGNTQVGSAGIHAAGTSSGLQPTTTVEGTTGTGTKFQALVTLAALGGGISAVTAITVPGNYSVNPTTLSDEPVTDIGGAGLTGAALSVNMVPRSVTITNAGVFTANPAGGNFTQASTSGSGTGITFHNAIMGPAAVTVAVAGTYLNFPANPVAQASTTGAGAGVTFTVTTSLAPGGAFNNGDWLFLEGIGGMTELNGQTVVASNVSGNTFSLNDVYGNPINSSAFAAYTSGGTALRIFTLPTPYAEGDLQYLKFAQSADVMSLCCVNQETPGEYAPYDLSRLSDSDWTLAQLDMAPTALPPTNAAASASTSGSIDYQYVVTAVAPDGTESIPSNIAEVDSAVDIAATAGAITVTWDPSPTADVPLYNVYKATPGYSAPPPVGALFGFAGQAYGTQFIDSNIVADFAQVPPTHQNPFARGSILGVQVTNSTGTVTSVVLTINTATGSGAVLAAVIVSSVLVSIIVLEPGENYGASDTLSITVTGGGSATATLSIGPQNGTYPGCVTYFQERRVYGYTLNAPDTYFMSQPGSFTNFDYRIPTIDSDAIIGSPWSLEVNGIQWMLLMPAGLLVMTGLSAWLLVGAGSFATNVQPISPSSQDANPQAFTGVSATVPPIKINYDVLYVNSKGSLYYDLPYQLYALSEPLDISQNSLHLFEDFSVVQHAWCEQPFKQLWAVRDDGVLLSLAFLKAEQVCGWGHSDTNGSWQSVCSIIEPTTPETPVVPGSPGSFTDALYLCAQRQIGANTAYTIERMDNREWEATEDVWAVDCGFSTSLPAPAASLTASSATGLGAVTGVTNLVHGGNYSSATTATVVDAPLYNGGPIGPGAGAVPALTIVAGEITAVTFSAGNQGSGYLNPQLVIYDPAGSSGGSGASARCVLANTVILTAGASVFSAGSVGQILRMGGGIIAVTAFTSGTQVTGNILSPIIDVNPQTGAPNTALAGQWSLAPNLSSVYIPQLAGATVTGLIDGNVMPPAVVPANGTLVLPQAGSLITLGFGFAAQLQTVYLDAQGADVQGQRKKIADVTLRLEASAGVQVGSNQPDASTQSPRQVVTAWANLDSVPNLAPQPYNGLAQPLYTGDTQAIPVTGGYQKPGQVAAQQTNPLPMQILGLFPRFLEGDQPDVKAQPQQQRRAA